MTGIHETAYPRLMTEFTAEELTAVYTPSSTEIKFVFTQYRQAGPRTFLLIQLKLLQRLGYFVPLASVPSQIIEYICLQARLRRPLKRALLQYDQSGSKLQHHQRLRTYQGIRAVDKKAEQWLETQGMQAAQTKQELPDIINVLIEELVQRRYELPGFTFLFRLSRRCRNTVNDLIYKSIAGGLDEQTTQRLDDMLTARQGQSVWDGLKREPKQPNVREDIQPDTLHGDTQAQSTPVFGLAHLLGINLMPRIRNIKDLVFFKADRHDQYEHIGSLFRGNIDWDLLARHLKDMLRVVISIKAGKIAPILRRLGTASRKNRLYYVTCPGIFGPSEI